MSGQLPYPVRIRLIRLGARSGRTYDELWEEMRTMSTAHAMEHGPPLPYAACLERLEKLYDGKVGPRSHAVQFPRTVTFLPVQPASPMAYKLRPEQFRDLMRLTSRTGLSFTGTASQVEGILRETVNTVRVGRDRTLSRVDYVCWSTAYIKVQEKLGVTPPCECVPWRDGHSA